MENNNPEGSEEVKSDKMSLALNMSFTTDEETESSISIPSSTEGGDSSESSVFVPKLNQFNELRSNKLSNKVEFSVEKLKRDATLEVKDVLGKPEGAGDKKYATVMVATRRICEDFILLTAAAATSTARQGPTLPTSNTLKILFRISIIVRDRFGLQMLSRLEKPSGTIKLVDNEVEMQEIYDQMVEMNADVTKFSALLSDFKRHNEKVEEVVSVFGEETELEELLGEYPELED